MMVSAGSKRRWECGVDMTEIVTTRFDIIRLRLEADIVAYTTILAKKIKSLEMSIYYDILVMPDMIKFKNSNPLRLVEIKGSSLWLVL